MFRAMTKKLSTTQPGMKTQAEKLTYRFIAGKIVLQICRPQVAYDFKKKKIALNLNPETNKQPMKLFQNQDNMFKSLNSTHKMSHYILQ